MEPDPEGKPIRVPVVTLLLKPIDAEKIVQASSVASIHFVLRNGSDRTHYADAAPDSGQTASVQSGYRSLKAPTLARTYEVETQLGDKKIVNSFN